MRGLGNQQGRCGLGHSQSYSSYRSSDEKHPVVVNDELGDCCGYRHRSSHAHACSSAQDVGNVRCGDKCEKRAKRNSGDSKTGHIEVEFGAELL